MIHTGRAFLECPVGGTVNPALDGALVGMAAGDRVIFDRIRPLLDETTLRLDFSVMWATRMP